MKKLFIIPAVVALCLSFTATVGAEPNLSEMISGANDGLEDFASDARDDISEFFDGVGDMSDGFVGDETGDSLGDISGDIGDITVLPPVSEDSESVDITELPTTSDAEITEMPTPVPDSQPDTDTPSTGDHGIIGFAIAALSAAVVALGISKKKA